MEFSTQCPVCGKNLDGSFAATTRHVNMCMDDKQSFKAIDVLSSKITSAVIDGKRTFKYCPICFKLTKVTAKHLKSCRRVKGIDTKDLISLCETEPSKPKNQKVNEQVTRKHKKGEADQPLFKLYPSDLAKLTKPIVIPNGDLTKLSIKEKNERINNRVDLIMSNISYLTHGNYHL
uniref:Uncharacterized protein n=1 Tax=Tetranychus urticae TaxID=32264 RepID=T1K4I2_TETUR